MHTPNQRTHNLVSSSSLLGDVGLFICPKRVAAAREETVIIAVAVVVVPAVAVFGALTVRHVAMAQIER